jgi:hypothetical protein
MRTTAVPLRPDQTLRAAPPQQAVTDVARIHHGTSVMMNHELHRLDPWPRRSVRDEVEVQIKPSSPLLVVPPHGVSVPV